MVHVCVRPWHREVILKNRNTNRLLLELQEERVQRLQDLEEIYAKDKQLEALVGEVVRVVAHITSMQIVTYRLLSRMRF
jgi:hypothetical protein